MPPYLPQIVASVAVQSRCAPVIDHEIAKRGVYAGLDAAGQKAA
jgi:hypothetical protein